MTLNILSSWLNMIRLKSNHLYIIQTFSFVFFHLIFLQLFLPLKHRSQFLFKPLTKRRFLFFSFLRRLLSRFSFRLLNHRLQNRILIAPLILLSLNKLCQHLIISIFFIIKLLSKVQKIVLQDNSRKIFSLLYSFRTRLRVIHIQKESDSLVLIPTEILKNRQNHFLVEIGKHILNF